MSCEIDAEVFSNINITAPLPYQVFQRNEEYVGEISVSGTYDGEGPIEFKLDDLSWQRADLIDGYFSAAIKDVPVGGPYTLELRSADGAYIRIPNLLVGDLWVLAGQSNMDGFGKLIHLESPHKMVHAFYYNEKWDIARDPLCRLNESVDPVHWSIEDPVEREKSNQVDREFGTMGAGLGVRFGKEMYKATGIPIGLIVCSHGGTSIKQWDPALKTMGGRSLYGSMLRRIQAVGNKVAGFLWYQGESDALSADKGVGYIDEFRNFIEKLRADLDSPQLPFVYVQLGPFFGDDSAAEGWNRVQTDQLALESEISNVAMVPAVDCTLSDLIHLDSVSLRQLGARMALQALRLKFGREDIRSGPRPADVSFLDSSRTKLRIKFKGVNGALRPTKGRCGFTVDVQGVPQVVKGWERAKNDPTSVVVTLKYPAPTGATLWYGRGTNPPCELRDSLGFPVPVFGPVTV
jgi:sialate O-acetylesterase